MADDDTFVVGAPLPRIADVRAHDGLRVVVTWASDGPGATVQVVDLAPAVFRYKLYAPLRDDERLFRAVRVIDDGFAVAWGEGDDLDMASTTIGELAEQAMTPADFGAFMKRNGYTLDSVAAELGISRRLAAYYAKDREVPRYIALACRFLDRTPGPLMADAASVGMGLAPAMSGTTHAAAAIVRGAALSSSLDSDATPYYAGTLAARILEAHAEVAGIKPFADDLVDTPFGRSRPR